MIYPYVVIDNNKYAVATGTYIRHWVRSFTSQLAANIIRLNFIDRGPGVRTYNMALQLSTWKPGSLLYNAGITKTAEQQMADLEASYAKVAKSLQFQDAFGNPPSASSGVFFTNMDQIIPNYATTQKSYILVDVEITESTQEVNGV
jgi:hypothetical protein